MSASSVLYSSETSVTGLDFATVVSRSRYYNTRETDIRQRLSDKTSKENNVSLVYRETLRGMIASFNDVGYIDAENAWKEVKVIHANPERAIAKLKQETNIILPIISVSQTVSNNDVGRNRYDSILVNQSYWDEDTHKAVRILSFAPRAISINYNIHVWSKYNSDLDQILEQIRLKFNPELSVPTSFSTLTKAFIDSEDNSGSVEADDKEDRILKKTFDVVVRTYIPNPKFLVTSTGALERINIEAGIK